MPFSPDDPITKKDKLAQAGQALANTVNESSLTFVASGDGGLQAHLNTLVGAHQARAISLQDAGLFYSPDPSTNQKNVEAALQELGSLIPAAPPVLGNAGIPNTGLINWDDLNTPRVGAFTRPYTTGIGPVAAGQIIVTDNITAATPLAVRAIVYPADRGNLVVRVAGSVVAELALRVGDGMGAVATFVEATRTTGQSDYVATMAGTDRISLYDRLPRLSDYSAHVYTNTSGIVYGDYEEDFYTHQIAVLQVSVDVNADDQNGTIEVVHYINGQAGATYSNNLSANVRRLEVFRDDGLSASGSGTLSTVTFSANTPTAPSSPKRISGVNYYNSTTLDTFTLNMTSAVSTNKAFANSYLSTGIMRVTPSGLGTSIQDFNLSQLSEGYVSLVLAPAIQSVATLNVPAYVLGTNAFSANASVSGTFSDPFSTSPGLATTSPKILVNTYSVVATDTVEFFREESRRYQQDTSALPTGQQNFDGASSNYPPTPIGAQLFDSTTDIDTNTKNGLIPTTEALQVGGRQANPNQSGLLYPQDDYSTDFQPSTSQPNYSAKTGSRTFYRSMLMPGIQTFGRIRLSATTTSGGAHVTAVALSAFQGTGTLGAMEIAIKIPGVTASWHDLGVAVGSTSTDTTPLPGCLDSSVIGHDPSTGFFGFSFSGPVPGADLRVAVRIRSRGVGTQPTLFLARLEILN